jgi:hypothetical protein
VGSDPVTEALIRTAVAVLGRPTVRLGQDPVDVPDCAGLYAVHGSADTWHVLGLEPPADTTPLYVGKAETSLVTRDINTHFRAGRTGQSTVRRTFAALLRGTLILKGIPRNTARPAHFANYGLSSEDDEKLSAWMRDHLMLAVWPKPPSCPDLGAVERGVIRHWCPPLNLKDNRASKSKGTLKAARKVMADEARASSGKS